MRRLDSVATLRRLHAEVVLLAEECGLADHAVTVTVDVSSSAEDSLRSPCRVLFSASVQAPITHAVVVAARWKPLGEILPCLRGQLMPRLHTSTDVLDESVTP